MPQVEGSIAPLARERGKSQAQAFQPALESVSLLAEQAIEQQVDSPAWPESSRLVDRAGLVLPASPPTWGAGLGPVPLASLLAEAGRELVAPASPPAGGGGPDAQLPSVAASLAGEPLPAFSAPLAPPLICRAGASP